MPETHSLVGIYGAIDQRVQTDLLARARVSQLLTPYLNEDVHWYDDFLKWVGEPEGAEDDKSAFPTIGKALEALGEEPASGRILARRMFAITVLTRAFPEMRAREVDHRPLAVRALRQPPGPGGEPDEPEALYALLAGEDGPLAAEAVRGPGWLGWEKLIQTAADRGLVPQDKVGMLPQPCSGHLMTVPGVKGPVAVLRTEYETNENEFEFDKAVRFMEPLNWLTCMPDFWCGMSVIPVVNQPEGQRRYHETVSTHCTDKAQPGFWAETKLDFDFMWLPDEKKAVAAVANYTLAPGYPLSDVDPIQVDEGTLVVEKVGDGSKLKLTTTKRVKFSIPFVTEALPLFSCALGYADNVGGLLACAAKYGEDFKGTDFPGVPVAQASATAATAAGASGSGGGPGQSGPGGLLQDGVEIWARSMRDLAAAIERGSGVAGARRPARKSKPGS